MYHVLQFGKGLGPAMRRVLLRLFLVLDANGSGALEYEVSGHHGKKGL